MIKVNKDTVQDNNMFTWLVKRGPKRNVYSDIHIFEHMQSGLFNIFKSCVTKRERTEGKKMEMWE